MSITVARDEAAMAQLDDLPFAEQWDALHRQCRWSTAFQSRGFVTAWYRCYRKSSEPVLVYSKAKDGTLSGLLALGVDRERGSWHIAGDRQAEYQAWLARDNSSDGFIGAALHCLTSVHGLNRLCFEYLPPGTPLAWTGCRKWRWLCSLEPRSRPLMTLDDPAHLAASLRKKGNRSRINRLKRKGDLRLVEIRTRSELAARLPEIQTLYDLRICSLHGHAPFHDDPCKREFHLALMEVPGLLHASALLRDGRVLAAHLGVRENDVLYNGIPCHSPSETRNSPGKMMILLLAQVLSGSGFRFFDLTPGLDLWKENFATHHDTVARLSIHANPVVCVAARLKTGLRAQIVKVLRRLEIEPRHVSSLVRKNVAEWLQSRRRQITHRLDMRSHRVVECQENHARDRLEDLFAFAADDAPVRQRFLQRAVAALSSGCHVYTLVRNARLIHFGWLDPAPGQSNDCVLIGGFESPAGGVLTAGDILGGLEQMCRDAAALPHVDRIYATVDAADQTHRQALEKIGFRSSQMPIGSQN